MFGRKQKEIERLRAKVVELEAVIAEYREELDPGPRPISWNYGSPREIRKYEPELSADEYKEQVLKPLGYKFTEAKPDAWMGATRDEWKVNVSPKVPQ